MEELTTVFAIFGEMVVCIALGYEIRVIAEMKHKERVKRRRERMKNERYSNIFGSKLPLGTEVYIDTHRYTVENRDGALQYGRRQVELYIEK